MKKFSIQIILLFVVIFGALFYFNSSHQLSSNNINPAPSIVPSLLKVGNTQLNVEIADTPQKRQLGLGGRESLATDSGMLFTFDSESTPIFWMKGMKIPLDFIWIRNNKVVNLTKQVPPPAPGTKDADLTRYTSSEPVNEVLEVNAGFVDQNGIKLGDSIER